MGKTFLLQSESYCPVCGKRLVNTASGVVCSDMDHGGVQMGVKVTSWDPKDYPEAKLVEDLRGMRMSINGRLNPSVKLFTVGGLHGWIDGVFAKTTDRVGKGDVFYAWFPAEQKRIKLVGHELSVNVARKAVSNEYEDEAGGDGSVRA